MAVGQFPFPAMNTVKGVRIGSACAGIKTAGREDLVVFEFIEGTRVAGVFTKNAFCAAPVTVCKNHLKQAEIRYLVANSGNANACTGAQGMDDSLTSCHQLARLGGVESNQVLPFSTGVIGVNLPMDKLTTALPEAFKALRDNGWASAAQGILTTDSRPKGASVQFMHEGETVTVTGVAKGSGMIRPDMATMLAYIATDAPVAKDVLQALLLEATNLSFNRITVDGDTSTNDSCILAATGQVSLSEITETSGEFYEKLRSAVIDVQIDLAKNIVSDGEGATKWVTIEVHGGSTEQESIKVGYAVAHSPLVKTALFASDPNWGRIVAAIGYADVEALDANKVKVWLGDVLIVENGGCASTYTEEAGQQVMNKEEILIRIDLNRGADKVVLWTTDLSYEYVKINAEYRS